MTLQEFQQLALITWNTAPEKDMQIVNAAIGIADEVGELLELLAYDYEVDVDELKKELGDVFYYIAVLSHLTDIKLYNRNESLMHSKYKINGISNEINSCTIKSSKILGIVKKYIFHGHDLDRSILNDFLRILTLRLSILCNTLNVNQEECMQLTINKLRKRYGDKFSSEKSINRIE